MAEVESFNSPLVDELQDVAIDVVESMDRYIKDNYNKDEIEPYPSDWMGDSERAEFARRATILLGESRADHWLQSHVFKFFGSEYLGFNDPIEIPAKEMWDVNLGPLGEIFLRKHEKFLDSLVRKMGESKRYRSDRDRIHDGTLAGVAYALSAPKEGNLDQRLNFFIRFPQVLMFDYICRYIEDVSLARHLSSRIRASLDIHKLSLKDTSQFTGIENQAGYMSVFQPREKIAELKPRMISALSEIANNSPQGTEDGLLSYLLKLILSSGCEELQNFVAYHIGKCTLSSRTREKRRKSHEISLYQETKRGVEIHYKLRHEEEVTEEGVIIRSASYTHSLQRDQTYLEKMQRAQKIREITSQKFKDTEALVEEIISVLNNEAKAEADSIIAAAQQQPSTQKTNESDILGLLLPEALSYYVKAANDQIQALIIPDNEADFEQTRLKKASFLYQKGRTSIAFDVDGERNLKSIIDVNVLDTYLIPYRQNKKAICEMHEKGMNPETIAKSLKVELQFVENTIRQIKVIRLSSVCQRLAIWDLFEKGMKIDAIAKSLGLPSYIVASTVAEHQAAVAANKSKSVGKPYRDFFDNLTAANVKNGFSWRWGRILQILYAPVLPHPINTALIEEESRILQKKLQMHHVPSKKKDEYSRIYQLYLKGQKEDFLIEVCKLERKILLRRKLVRVYHSKARSALNDLSSLLTAHTCIEKGTIPAGVFPDSVVKHWNEIKDFANVQPGKAWGHNICRTTGESNVHMYYDIFYGGLARYNEDHKPIRLAAATILRIRRGKTMNGGRKRA